MPGATRKSQDSCGGTLVAGSPNVITNGTPQVRVGDAIQGHGPGEHGGPVMAKGSPNVIVNNIPACRAGDPGTCGHASTGSNNVFIN